MAGSIFKPGGLTGMLGNLKNSVYNSGGIIMGPGVGTTAAGIGGPLGTVAGVASSPAAGMAGLMLGINGVQRQGVGGTIEAGLGGALAGFSLGSQIGSLGGPMGAAIGAGAVFSRESSVPSSSSLRRRRRTTTSSKSTA
jgi:hypothetical protein